ncbi:hypothetical protein KUTeg_011882 [Tegillarca granosa]|uniref:Uncharacterized protein n=1 Tax=Tegillarca granosa TaxID=220873 RepID=A0ABQ9F2A3_TEGGR|nr:hypothetical protein KUTeg_011882 [Tegillarca granosa]
MVLLVWPFYYLFNSFSQEFPWSQCGHEWNTKYCVSWKNIMNTTNNTEVINMTGVDFNQTTSPSAEYFRKEGNM